VAKKKSTKKPTKKAAAMGIDEEAIKLQARLVAIEYAICELYSAFYRGVQPADVHQRHDQLVGYFRKQPVPGHDPAMSDLLAGEAETALRELLTRIELHVKMPRPKREGE
jgi:hypothetical protein